MGRATSAVVPTALLLVLQDDGTSIVDDVDISKTVFDDAAATGSNARGFATAADDAVHVIDFIHLYAVPRRVSP